MTEYRFMKNKLLEQIKLGGRVFLFEMPANKEKSMAIHTLKDEIQFAKLIYAKERFHAMQVGNLQVNGIIAITFEDSAIPDSEIIRFIADCASKCTFE